MCGRHPVPRSRCWIRIREVMIAASALRFDAVMAFLERRPQWLTLLSQAVRAVPQRPSGHPHVVLETVTNYRVIFDVVCRLPGVVVRIIAVPMDAKYGDSVGPRGVFRLRVHYVLRRQDSCSGRSTWRIRCRGDLLEPAGGRGGASGN